MARSTPSPTTAVLFPGQGSHRPGMRELVASTRPELLDMAAEACGADPFERLDEGTRFQQPAILCASLAGWERAREQRPSVLAGHSLGELAALAAAGALPEADALRVVAARGRAMDDAARRAPAGGMLAVRAGRDLAAAVGERAGAVVANENAPDQTVLAGSRDALATAAAILREQGVRTVELPVSGPFHSPAMVAAEEPLRAALSGVPFREPRLPVISSMTAMPFADPRTELVAALTRPVRWVEVMRALGRDGVGRFVEAGPGSVLAKLVRRTLPDAEALTVDAPEAARA